MITRTALVTGGASGLGAATAKRLRAGGLTVTTLDLHGAYISADVTDEEALRLVADEFGPRRRARQLRRHRRTKQASPRDHRRGVAPRPRRQRAGDGEHHAGLRPRHVRARLGPRRELRQHGRPGPRRLLACTSPRSCGPTARTGSPKSWSAAAEVRVRPGPPARAGVQDAGARTCSHRARSRTETCTAYRSRLEVLDVAGEIPTNHIFARRVISVSR